ncbi:hypothetical protein PCNPT3_12320 [Psychromonas sp. CNPT3]|nr:hypothetical protein PCNPT3_12320 [Psychromonas sp. CNPT3]
MAYFFSQNIQCNPQIYDDKSAYELIKFSCITQEKLALARRELQEIVALTSKFTTQGGIISTSKTDHSFSSFGIIQSC